MSTDQTGKTAFSDNELGETRSDGKSKKDKNSGKTSKGKSVEAPFLIPLPPRNRFHVRVVGMSIDEVPLLVLEDLKDQQEMSSELMVPPDHDMLSALPSNCIHVILRFLSGFTNREVLAFLMTCKTIFDKVRLDFSFSISGPVAIEKFAPINMMCSAHLCLTGVEERGAALAAASTLPPA